MSIETDIRAALVAHAPLTAIVGQRVSINAIEQGQPAPYVVFTVSQAPQFGLNGTSLGCVSTVDVQCWASTAVQASAIADAATAAMAATGVTPLSRANGFDPEVGLDAAVLSFDWLTG